MNKIFKNHLSLCAFTTAVLFFVSNVDSQVQAAAVSGKVQNGRNYFSCDKNGSFYRCNDGREHSVSRKTYQKTDESNAEGAAIEASKYQTKIIGSDITIQGGENSGSLDKSSWKYGVVASNWGTINILTGAIDFKNAVGVHASGKGSVYLTNVSIIETGSQATDVNNNNENSAFQMSEDLGYISFNKGNVKVSNAHGVSLMGIASGIDIHDSTVIVEGHTSYGIYLFDKQEHQYDKDIEELYKRKEVYSRWNGLLSDSLPRGEVLKRGGVSLHGGSFTVPDSVAIYSKKSGGIITLKRGSSLSGDLLLKVKDSSFVKVVAEGGASLVGGVRIDESSDAQFGLMEKSKWTLTRPKNKELQGLGSIGVSSISLIDLIDSSILFAQPGSSEAGNYQTLVIGKGSGEVYKAQGNSEIHFNVHLGSRDLSGKQISDRLVIHGDVSGQTKIHVRGVSENTKNEGDELVSPYSFPIIQVYGQAKKDSFILDGGYVTLGNLPYRYVLRAYGPVIPLKIDYFVPELAASSKNIWYFRLEDEKSKSIIAGYNAATDKNKGGSSGEEKGSGGSVTPSVSVSSEDSVHIVTEPSSHASEPGRSASESGNPTVQASNLTLQDGGPTSELGVPTPQIDGSTLQTGNPTAQVGNLTPQDGSPTSELVSTPVGTGATLSIQSNEGSENVRTITHEGAGVPVAGETSSVVSAGTPAPEAVSPTSQTGNLTLQAGSSAPQAGKPASELGSSTLQDGKSPSIVKPEASEESRVPAVSGVSSAGKEGTPAGCNGIGRNGAGQSQGSILCSDGKSYTVQQLTLNANNSTQHSMHVKSGTNVKLNAATIIGPDSGNRNAVDLAKLSSVSAVFAEENAEVVLENKSIIQSSVIGLEAKSGGKVKMDNGTVNARYMAALAGTGAVVTLKNTQINVEGDSATAGLVSKGGDITMESGTITMKKGVAVQSEKGGHVRLNKVRVIAKKEAREPDSANKSEHAAILLNNNSVVEFTHGDVVTDANALWIRDGDGNIEQGSSRRRRSSDVRPSMNHANIEFSTIKVESDNSYGIYFDGAGRKAIDQQSQNKIPEKIVSGSSVEDSGKGSLVKRSAVRPQEKAPISITGVVSLKRTNFEVLKSIAIYGNNSGGRVSLKNGTNLTGDLLLKAENNSHMSVLVDNSSIMGGVRVDKTSYATLDLTNRSEWYLTRSAHKNLRAPDSECVDSCISSVSLVNSDIHFLPSQSEELEYQTLRIGEGKGTVYKAQGDVSIHFKARLNPNDSSDRQVSDRLVIHGDVEGKTVVSVRGVSGSVGENNGSDKTAHSVSVIQVYGKAEKDSFRLDSDYVALGNSPYKYTLRSYSPEMTSKQEHVQQKFMKDGGEFWNFRLENQYVKSESFDANIISKADTISLPRKVVRSVVPQVPTYLLLPNSVFHAGLMDISNQNKQLETLRTTSSGMVEIRENPALYLRGYGGSYRYASDLSALEYGYGGDLSYNGVEAGVLLKTIENADNAISFGIMGSYGKLSLQPQDVEQSQESAFDKWTATAYGSLQHETGLYVDGLLSYGLFKGDVVTLARGKTATLKGNPLSVSLTGGQTLVTGYEGFVFDPQVQVVYQHLQFSKAHDIDDFDIELGKLDQWVARVGGRLSRASTGFEGVNAVAFYGKLYFAHGFGGNKSVHFKDAFQLGAFGSSLEAGLGFNAKLSSQFSLHGDVVYQHKLNKAGFSGTSFSGGIRYRF
ncbi:autotransporter outer membrane beta-barrel domain-containing protein [Bartonella taylorii]|uniref:autotransporter outer membrane beta-barrel domain-containing protein n=1 Tax=Bartonella taylorii TaxID=33046 RepID=UPI001ABA877A|nr:autotransporter outer membrane beta-barrel domain-containing protein [Bartonella taylorii]